MHLLDSEKGIFILPYFVEQFKPHFAVFMKRNQRILGKFLTKLTFVGSREVPLYSELPNLGSE